MESPRPARKAFVRLHGEIKTPPRAPNANQRKHLAAAGFMVEDDASEFLGLDAAERQLVALRVAAARAVREARASRNMTQGALAKAIKSSQSRVAKIEAAAPDVSLDLSFRALFAAGGSFASVRPAPVKSGRRTSRGG